MNKEYIPLDQWCEEEAPGLFSDIKCHIKVMLDEDLPKLNKDEQYSLVRLIMGSVRNHLEDHKK